jgi:trans-aconitate methyltransferase
MDSDKTDFDTFRACLTDLAKVNRLTLAYWPTLAFFKKLAKSESLPRDRPIVIIDAGCGCGDMLREVDRWAARNGFKVELTGVDLNPWSTRAAKEMTAPERPIRFITANIFDYRPSRPADIVISSLFAHHLHDALLIRFLSWMEENAEIGWFVNDLHRHPIPFHLFRVLSAVLRLHYFVQHDGPISIARAFTASDWRRLLTKAGISAAEVSWRFPFRLCVSRR